MDLAVILVWKLWTVYAPMFAATAILSCIIEIRGLFKSTKRFKMSNLRLSRPGVMVISHASRSALQIYLFHFPVSVSRKAYQPPL